MYDVVVVYLMREKRSLFRTTAEVLLGRKLTGLGVGKFVGAGGKVEPGETVREAAIREVREELGVEVDPDMLFPVAHQYYPFVDRPEWSQQSYAFVAYDWSGEPAASEELDPEWFDAARLPFDRMWPDAAEWLPEALSGEYVSGEYRYRADGSLASNLG